MGGQTNVDGDAFRVIAECIDTIQAAGGELRDVTIDDGAILSDGTIQVHLKLALPELSAVASLGVLLEGESVTLTEDDTCLLEVTIDVPLDELPSLEQDDGPSLEERPAGADAEPSQQESHEPPAATNGGSQPAEPSSETTTADATDGEDTSTASSATESADGAEASTETGEKPYRDPERLRAVYEKYETFPEMRDALDVDVTAQTVRRHMIKHGIHEVSSNTALEALQNADANQMSHLLGAESSDESPRGREARTDLGRQEPNEVADQQFEDFDNTAR